MRIALDARHVADHFPGIGRYVYGLAAALAALGSGHALILITCPVLPNTRFDLRALVRPGVELLVTDARPFSLAEQHAIPRLLRQAGADLYHSPYYVMPYTGLPCPAVVTLYDVIPRLFPGEVTPRARLLFDLFSRLAIHASAGVITISNSARDDLAGAFRVAKERITVTPLAADPVFQPQPMDKISAVRVRYGLSARYVLCLSSNKPHKNLPALVQAWGLLAHADQARGTQLVIAGHWDARYPEVQNVAVRLGIDAGVRFLPNVAEHDLPALYSGATLFAYPSRYEGFGLPPLEAMACGVPVVCGDASSLPEVVGIAARRVDVCDPMALALGIGQVLKDGDLRAHLAAAGREQAARFSWQRTAARTLRVYEASC